MFMFLSLKSLFLKEQTRLRTATYTGRVKVQKYLKRNPEHKMLMKAPLIQSWLSLSCVFVFVHSLLKELLYIFDFILISISLWTASSQGHRSAVIELVVRVFV